MTPLLLLHPLGSDASFWSCSAGLLGRPVLAPDLLGHGAKRDQGSTKVATAASYAADVLEGINEPVVAVGVSLGGVVALALADQHPDVVTALVLVDTVATYPSPFRDTWPARAGLARSDGLDELADAMETMWFGEDFRARHPLIVAAARRIFLATDPEGYARSCELLHAVDLSAALPRITVPTLVVCGDLDAPAFVDAAPGLAESVPDGTLRWLPGAKHAGVLEQPETFAAMVRGFLAERGL